MAVHLLCGHSFHGNTGLENDDGYTDETYRTNRWSLPSITTALLEGTPNYSPYSPSAHYIRFTQPNGFEAVYGRFRSHNLADYQTLFPSQGVNLTTTMSLILQITI